MSPVQAFILVKLLDSWSSFFSHVMQRCLVVSSRRSDAALWFPPSVVSSRCFGTTYRSHIQE